MNDVSPDVSVIVPVHNAATYLQQTFMQLAKLDTGVRYEYVIIDDHSTDESRRIVDELRGSLTGPVLAIRAEGRGVAAARNEALRHCSGSYVWFTDADDRWEPETVAAMLARAEETHADVVTCDAVKVTPEGDVIGKIDDGHLSGTIDGEAAFRQLLDGSLQGHLWNKLFRRELLGVAPFPALSAHSDLAGMLQVIPRARSVASVGRVLYRYAQNPGSILNSKTFDPENLRTCFKIAAVSAQGLRLGATPVQALTIFKYRNILIPIMGEYVRRAENFDRPTRNAQYKRIRQDIRWHEIPRVWSLGGAQLAAQAAVLKTSGAAYAALYDFFRPSTVTR